jgi:hypothetical protein
MDVYQIVDPVFLLPKSKRKKKYYVKEESG